MNQRKKSFGALVVTQLLGAFNDNLFKQLVLLLAANTLFPDRDMQGFALAMFALPFIMFSGIAGDLSERFSKQRIIVMMKWAELVVMGFGLIALQLKSWPLLLIALCVMGAQSAFFGPPKYAGIPELVDKRNLVRANGVVTMTTFIAVLTGTTIAGPLLDEFGDQLWVTGGACIAISILGVISARRIEPLPAQIPQLKIGLNPFGRLWSTTKTLGRQEGLLTLVFLNSAFYFNAAVIQSSILGLGGPDFLNVPVGSKKHLTFVIGSLSIAVGVGAMLAPRLTARFRPGWVVACAALTMVTGQLGFNGIGAGFDLNNGGLWVMHLSAIWVGLAGACVIVPVTSYLQYAPKEGMRGMTFGLTNFSNFLFIFLSAAYYQALRLPATDWSPALIQSISGLLMLLALWFSRKQMVRLAFN